MFIFVYRDARPRFRTIMTHESQHCKVPKKHYFSNPNVNDETDWPTGIVGESNNAKHIILHKVRYASTRHLTSRSLTWSNLLKSCYKEIAPKFNCLKLWWVGDARAQRSDAGMALTSEDRSMPHACRADGLSCASICPSFAFAVRNLLVSVVLGKIFTLPRGLGMLQQNL